MRRRNVLAQVPRPFPGAVVTAGLRAGPSTERTTITEQMGRFTRTTRLAGVAR